MLCHSSQPTTKLATTGQTGCRVTTPCQSHINGGTSGSVIHLSHLTRLAEQPSVLEKRSDRPGLCDSIISSQDERQVDGLIDGEVGSNTGSFNECSQPDYSDLLLLSSQPYLDQLLTNYELGGTLSSDEPFYQDHSRDIEIDTASMADCGRLPGATFP
jgi:hypothetical protein